MAVLTISLNTVAIVSISRSSQLKEKPCYFLIQIQSVIDLVKGAISQPLFVYYLLSETLGVAHCQTNLLIKKIVVLPVVASILTLSLMNFERYTGVLHPFVHRTRLTKKIILKTVCFSFCLIFILSIILAIYGTFRRPLVIMMLALFLSSSIFIYVNIFFVARKSLYSHGIPYNHQTEGDRERMKRLIRFQKELKLARSCFRVLIAFIISYLPGQILVAMFAS